ncbi:multicopper oxidase domain-containing protein [Nocardioides sp.]|uniref:multicopper oxidase family protein n=1 Tax=Nocardioides sp. TaxID=35761 RepID=UPI00286CC516|nr:multicopper oxidase domain-containing protein [Nocardioides sp.]
MSDQTDNDRPDALGPLEVDNPSDLVARRAVLRLGALGVTGAAVLTARNLWVPSLAQRGLLSPDGAFAAVSTAIGDLVLYTEDFPISPLILSPFIDPLPVPKALAPTPTTDYASWDYPPGPGYGQQNSLRNERHQIWPSQLGYPDPIVYKIELMVAPHHFTSSQVLPIKKDGSPAVSYDANGAAMPEGTIRMLPASTMYAFNGVFPGPMINAEYGKPVIVRFINRLHENPYGLDRQDFGAPDCSFLTHLHNGHTAPESDGNPHYAYTAGPRSTSGYEPTLWVDNLYLNWPAGGDEREKQSFFWFHDHRMNHTGSNVYKGLVGLYPIYDPKNGKDVGDERRGLRLPGVRRTNVDGSFDVDYDIPLAFSDVSLDDGTTTHHDAHDSEFPEAGNPRTHPEWWGKTFYRHFPNHGFVGDVFTVNGTAYPVLDVKRRKYRFRFLDASVSRIYEFKLMSSTQGPRSAVSLGLEGDELQGQWRIPDGQQCMRFTQIATDGGLLPTPIVRDSFELWPAKRREVIVDFTKFLDGSPTTQGDIVYLTNVMKMSTGRMWDNSTRSLPDPAYQVPVLAFRIGNVAPDDSRIPTTQMRALPPLPKNWKTLMSDRMVFEVKRGQAGGEIEWLINGEEFDPLNDIRSLRNPAGRSPLAQPRKGTFGLWELRNGGGGWVHPFHLHMEEHRTVMRDGRDVTLTPDAAHPDDASREDLVAMDPGESVIVYRGFRDFTGPYVAHCHNLAHEDHAMMFGWSIQP